MAVTHLPKSGLNNYNRELFCESSLPLSQQSGEGGIQGKNEPRRQGLLRMAESTDCLASHYFLV